MGSRGRTLRASRRAAAALLLFLAIPPAPGAAQQAVDLGAHGGLGPAPGEDCRACHPRYPSDRGITASEPVAVPGDLSASYADPVARTCWVCHRAGNPFGARPLEESAFAPGSHGRTSGSVHPPDAWAAEDPAAESYRDVGLPRAGADTMSCTTCHDVHRGNSRDFLPAGGGSGDASAACRACHPGRENPGLTGRSNIFVLSGPPYSNHPTDMPAGSGGADGAGEAATGSCTGCHAVHGSPASRGKPVPGLLRLGDSGDVSSFCLDCHPRRGEREGGAREHPVRPDTGGGTWLASLRDPEGIPSGWAGPSHRDGGATTYDAAGGEAPACTSCHDVHGGLPGTSLLFGPNTVAGGFGPWCANCHDVRALHPEGHVEPGAESGAGLSCLGCHGPARVGLPPSWSVHENLCGLRTPAAGGGSAGDGDAREVSPGGEGVAAILEALASDEPDVVREPGRLGIPLLNALEGAGEGDRERILVGLARLRELLFVDALSEALTSDRRRARDNAVAVLAALRSPFAGRPAAAALGDTRREVRAGAARVLGAIGDGRHRELLVGALADESAEVRAAAASSLGGLGDAGLTPVLVPLLEDGDAAVRLAAARTLGRLRDPRAYEPLVRGLRTEPVVAQRGPLLEVLKAIDDARVLDLMLEDGREHGENAWAIMEVMLRLTDPEGVRPMARALGAEHRLIRITAAKAIRRHGAAAVPSLAAALYDVDGLVTAEATHSLALINEPSSLAPLFAYLRDGSRLPGLRATVLAALATTDNRQVIPAVVGSLDDPVPLVVEKANAVLYQMTCRNFGKDGEAWRRWWRENERTFLVRRCR